MTDKPNANDQVAPHPDILPRQLELTLRWDDALGYPSFAGDFNAAQDPLLITLHMLNPPMTPADTYIYTIDMVPSSWKPRGNAIVENGVRRRYWFGKPGSNIVDALGVYPFAAKIELSPSSVWIAGPELQGRTISFIAATPLVVPDHQGNVATHHELGRFTEPNDVSLGYTEMLAVPR